MDPEITGKRPGSEKGEKGIAYSRSNDDHELAYVEDVVGLHRRLSNREHRICMGRNGDIC
jgi:hypothetical protein